MNFLRLFFSFYGRIGRTVYCGGIVVNLFAAVTVFFIADPIFLKSSESDAALLVKQALLAMAASGFVVSVSSLHIRRMHDRGQTGWLGLAGFAAISLCLFWIRRLLPNILLAEGPRIYSILLAAPGLVVLISTLYLFGVMRGQSGPNRFGPEPLD